jgi:hypothetical protein
VRSSSSIDGGEEGEGRGEEAVRHSTGEGEGRPTWEMLVGLVLVLYMSLDCHQWSGREKAG